ncbi:kinase-like domain-containing protein [Gigaspora rosea]|uniref:Kinase-like domain-containing protein n=1 Tax=Gigaspora rosea TaxID=44941 RepID=A0A397UXZ5_9GLOM|nr:kinase-like domain-containing protein [Gigaspora rosea]
MEKLMMNRCKESLADLLEIEPNNAKALRIRGKTYPMMKKHEESLADLNKSLEIEPNNAEALRSRKFIADAFRSHGEAYRMTNRYKKLLEELNKSLIVEPNNTIALRSRGETYLMMNRLKESLIDLNKSLEIEPNDAVALRIRGETYYMMYRYGASLADLNKSLEIKPNNAAALRIRGETYRMMNRYEESLADLNKSLEIEPNHSKTLRSCVKTLEYLNKSLNIKPNNAVALRIRGETYCIMNRYEESLADLNKSLEIEPNNADALRSREKTLKGLDKSLEIKPNNAVALRIRGETYRIMNRYEESLADLNKSLEINPNNADALSGRGETYRMMNKYEASLADLNKSLEIEPNNAGALSRRKNIAFSLRIRGETYRMENRYEESLVDLNKSLEIEPNNSKTLSNRGETYLMMNRYEEALADLNKSLEIEPNNAETLRNRGEIYYALTRYEESHQDLVRYKSLDGCTNCRYYNTSKTWCQLCDQKRIIRGWSSGNKEIDECVKKFQIKITKYEKLIEWIPFDRLVGLQTIGKGGFGTIYSAIWLDGKPVVNNDLRAREQSCKVALKTLSTLKEFENHVQCRLNGLGLEIYGITQHIETQTYLMVFQYANRGNMYDFLTSNFKELDWENKLKHLIDVSNDLARIHESGYIHCDFHSGNILLNQYSYFIKSFITDLGLSKSLKESASKGEVYGVMPYTAPEILLGEEFTQAADIYSLGIIMTELSTGKRPFYGSPFDYELALKICNGLRPGFSEKTPKCYIKLANQCMDFNPHSRPSAKDISSKFSKWRMIVMKPWISNSEESDIKRSFISANEEIKATQITLPNFQNSQYTSRLMNTKEIKLAYESAKFRGNFN